MMSLAQHRAAAAEPTLPDWRAISFVAFFLFSWLTLDPFYDLSSSETLELSSGREVTTYICFALFAAVCLGQVALTDGLGLRRLAVRSYISLAVWIAATCVTSQDFSTSLKRAAICGFVAVSAACLPLLPRGRFHLATLLATAAAVLVGLSYFGVIFMPQYAIHQASDIVELGLAGDWRGVFPHKNVASAVFSMVAFIGVYAARSGRPVGGWTLCGLSLIFVFASGGKSSTVLCFEAVLVSLLVTRPRANLAACVAAVLTPLVALNALGVGSIIVPELGAIAASLPLDTTFTGRTDIWSFAVQRIPNRPFLGHGFSAFWNSESARDAAADANSWAGQAAHAHNGYLDAALGMGLPGLAIVLWAFVIQPSIDVRRAARAGADPALLMMFAQIWLFGIYLSSFESFLFNAANPIWTTFLFAVFGLRYIACYKVAPL